MNSWICYSVFAPNIHTPTTHTNNHLSLQKSYGKEFYYTTHLLPQATVKSLACQLCVCISLRVCSTLSVDSSFCDTCKLKKTAEYIKNIFQCLMCKGHNYKLMLFSEMKGGNKLKV